MAANAGPRRQLVELAPLKDPDRTRFSQVTHYYFEGCKYFTPMRTEGESIWWREPVWIA